MTAVGLMRVHLAQKVGAFGRRGRCDDRRGHAGNKIRL